MTRYRMSPSFKILDAFNLSYRVSKWPSVSLCTEFMQVAKATTVGFLVMGFIGFFVKLIHIPINNIIMGG